MEVVVRDDRRRGLVQSRSHALVGAAQRVQRDGPEAGDSRIAMLSSTTASGQSSRASVMASRAGGTRRRCARGARRCEPGERRGRGLGRDAHPRGDAWRTAVSPTPSTSASARASISSSRRSQAREAEDDDKRIGGQTAFVWCDRADRARQGMLWCSDKALVSGVPGEDGGCLHWDVVVIQCWVSSAGIVDVGLLLRPSEICGSPACPAAVVYDELGHSSVGCGGCDGGGGWAATCIYMSPCGGPFMHLAWAGHIEQLVGMLLAAAVCASSTRPVGL